MAMASLNLYIRLDEVPPRDDSDSIHCHFSPLGRCHLRTDYGISRTMSMSLAVFCFVFFLNYAVARKYIKWREVNGNQISQQLDRVVL